MPKPDFRVPSSVLFSEVDGSLVLLNLQSEQYYGLDPVGANIITRLTQAPYAVAFEALAADYDVDPDELHRDIQDLIGELLGAGLIERVAHEGR